jgi:hypothetical protein
MHHQPRSEPAVAGTPSGGFNPAGSRRMNPRRALHRTARQHGMEPKHLSALIAQADQLARGEQQ